MRPLGVLTAGLVTALLAGAIVLEVSAPVRRRLAERIEETEEELEELGGE